jgi:hypothetical protein
MHAKAGFQQGLDETLNSGSTALLSAPFILVSPRRPINRAHSSAAFGKRWDLLAWAANRLAGAVFDDDETRLAPEPLIAEAAKATRLDTKPLADPRLIEALSVLTSSLNKEASLSPFGRLAAS